MIGKLPFDRCFVKPVFWRSVEKAAEPRQLGSMPEPREASWSAAVPRRFFAARANANRKRAHPVVTRPRQASEHAPHLPNTATKFPRTHFC